MEELEYNLGSWPLHHNLSHTNQNISTHQCIAAFPVNLRLADIAENQAQHVASSFAVPASGPSGCKPPYDEPAQREPAGVQLSRVENPTLHPAGSSPWPESRASSSDPVVRPCLKSLVASDVRSPVTVRSSRGVHPPSGGGKASRTDGSPVIAGTSNFVRVQAITA